MGLSHELVDKLQSDFASADGVFLKQLPPIPASDEYVYLEDSLTRILHHPGPQGNGQFTGLDYFATFIEPFRKHLEQRNCVAVVCSIDFPENVPRQKEHTQLARAIAARQANVRRNGGIEVKYDYRCTFNDKGICQPGNQDHEPFDIETLASSERKVRQKLFNYVFQQMKQEWIPESKQMFVELDSESAWCFTAGQKFVRDPATYHNHGESDPSLAWWLEHLAFPEDASKPHRVVVLRTKDTDVLPLVLWALHCQLKQPQPLQADDNEPPRSRRRPIYWMRSWDEIVDLNRVYDLVQTRYNISINTFVLYCILGGTDFLKKNELSNFIGVVDILAACKLNDKHFDVFQRRSTRDFVEFPLPGGHTYLVRDAQHNALERQSLLRFVSVLYQNKLDKPMKIVANKNNRHIPSLNQFRLLQLDRIRELWAERDQKRISVPSDSQLESAFKKVIWNYTYWTQRFQRRNFLIQGPIPIQDPASTDNNNSNGHKESLHSYFNSSSAAAASSSSSSSSSMDQTSSSSPPPVQRQQEQYRRIARNQGHEVAERMLFCAQCEKFKGSVLFVPCPDCILGTRNTQVADSVPWIRRARKDEEHELDEPLSYRLGSAAARKHANHEANLKKQQERLNRPPPNVVVGRFQVEDCPSSPEPVTPVTKAVANGARAPFNSPQPKRQNPAADDYEFAAMGSLDATYVTPPKKKNKHVCHAYCDHDGMSPYTTHLRDITNLPMATSTAASSSDSFAIDINTDVE
jgi:hypothetical protein